MLFNSIQFLCFFPAVTAIYYILPHRFRYIFLLIASYGFYMCWNTRYALLMLCSTLITYISGIALEKVVDWGGGARAAGPRPRPPLNCYWKLALRVQLHISTMSSSGWRSPFPSAVMQ